jgi:hypothetical protein
MERVAGFCSSLAANSRTKQIALSGRHSFRHPALPVGAYLMLAPLKPGKHKIAFVGVWPNLNLDITYDVTVEP